MLNSVWMATQRAQRAQLQEQRLPVEQKDPDGQEGLNERGEQAGPQEAESTKGERIAGERIAGEENAGEKNASVSHVSPSSSEAATKGSSAEGEAVSDPKSSESPTDETLEADAPLNYVTLGSVDADSPFRQLVTLTSQGAAVRRIELANPRYRDLQDRNGYLGHLESVSDPSGGVRIRTVGQGTPAAAAGLQPGDRIVAAGVKQAETVQTTGDLARALANTKPGQSLLLQVEREDAEPFECTALLGRRPLEVVRPEADNVLLWADKLPKGFVDQPSFLLTLQQLGREVLNPEAEERGLVELDRVTLRTANWEIVHQDDTSVTFRKRLANKQCEITKRYQLTMVPDGQQSNRDYPAYSLQLKVEITNLAQEAREMAYRLDGPNGLPMEGWWYTNKIGRSWGAAGIRDVIARSEGGDTVQIGPPQIIDDTTPPIEGKPLAYVGVDAQYFAVMLLPEKESLDDRWISETQTILIGPKPKARSPERRYANISCRLISKTNRVEPGASLQHTYNIFAGPKRTELLAQYKASGDPRYPLSDLLYYGWFTGVAKAMLWILHFFYGIVRNYGLAIIMLTVLVRGCMFPISRKQAASMAKMQELKPEMDRIKEKYKGDMQKQSQVTQELYRKYKINPMAGCLPMVIQLPIFVGLYRSLMVDVELRQAPLLSENIRWCSNLSAPDMFYDWHSFMPDFITSGVGILGLGPYLNVLPLVTICLFLLQQKMFMPEAANAQAAIQQKIIMYMIIFMGLMFFKVAAGLCLYFIASSSWGIAERKLIPSSKIASTNAGLLPETDTKTTARKSTPSRAASKNGKAQGKRRAKRKR